MAKDIPYFERLKKNLQDLNGAKIIVGVQGKPGKNFHEATVTSSEDLQKIAAVHEFGCDIKVTKKMRAWLHYNGINLKKTTTHIHIPERSYIRRTWQENKSSFFRKYTELGKKVIDDIITADKMLDILGKEAMTHTFDNIGNGAKPLSEFTKKRRENPNSTPLINSGKLQNHITYRIVKRSDSV